MASHWHLGSIIATLPNYIRFGTCRIQLTKQALYCENSDLLVPTLRPLNKAFNGTRLEFICKIDDNCFNPADYFVCPAKLLDFLDRIMSQVFDRCRGLDLSIDFESYHTSAMELLASILQLPPIKECSSAYITFSICDGPDTPLLELDLPIDAIVHWLYLPLKSNKRSKERSLYIFPDLIPKNTKELVERLKQVSTNLFRLRNKCLCDPIKFDPIKCWIISDHDF